MSNIIHVQTSPLGLLTINALAKAALQAHGFNPSPVDISKDLNKLSKEMLMQLEEDTTRLLQANKIICVDEVKHPAASKE